VARAAGSAPVFTLETIELDLPALAGALSERLRAAGVPVTAGHAAEAARALTLVKPITRRRLYWTLRAVFVSDQAQVKAFDAVFFAVFGRSPAGEDFEAPDAQTAPTPPDERAVTDHKSSSGESAEQDPRRAQSASPPRERDADEEEPEAELETPLAIAADDEVLAGKSFDALAPHGWSSRPRCGALAARSGVAVESASICARRCARASAPAATRPASPTGAGASRLAGS